MNVTSTILLSYIFSAILLGIFLVSSRIREKINWNVTVIGMLLPAVFSCILYFSYAEYVTADTEYFGGFGTVAEYIEDWDERVSCRHEISCSHTCTRTTGSGKDAKTESYRCHSNDGYYHSYDVDYHPPSWSLMDSNGSNFSIGQDSFEKLAKRWNNRNFVNLNRKKSYTIHSKDGNKHTTFFDNVDEHIEPTTIPHTYKNKVPASNSLLKFRDISPEEAISEGVYSYPEIHNNYQSPIIAPSSLGLSKDAYYFNLINSKLGRKKQVRCYLLVYLNKSSAVSEIQERYWQGGNKNEIIVMVGVDNDLNVKWARSFAWAFTSEEYGNKLRAESIKNFIAEQKKLDIPALGKWLYSEIEQKYVRRPFTPINDELEVAYPMLLSIICIILSNAITIALLVFPVANEINNWYSSFRWK